MLIKLILRVSVQQTLSVCLYESGKYIHKQKLLFSFPFFYYNISVRFTETGYKYTRILDFHINQSCS